MKVDVRVAQLKELAQEKAPQAIDRAIQLTAQEVWGNIGREAPKNHGLLAGSYNLQKQGHAQYGIWSPVKYRWWVHEGTGIYGPHQRPIVPVQAQSLRFEIDGQVIFAKSVKGQKPDRFIDRSIEKTETRVDEFIMKAIGEVK